MSRGRDAGRRTSRASPRRHGRPLPRRARPRRVLAQPARRRRVDPRPHATRSCAAPGVDPATARRPGYVRRAAACSTASSSSTPASSASRRARPRSSTRSTRLFLECAWEALENAGYDRRARPGLDRRLRRRRASSTYLLRNLLPQPGAAGVGRRLPAAARQRQRLPRHPRLLQARPARARASTSRPPARPRWSRSTSPARACSPASATWRSPAASRVARAAEARLPLPGGRHPLARRPLPRLRRRGAGHGRSATASASWCSSGWPTRWPTATRSTR